MHRFTDPYTTFYTTTSQSPVHQGFSHYFSITQTTYISRPTITFVQHSTSPQSFHRYTYALNNPLRYKDPSGELVVFAYFGIAFIAESISNLTTKIDHPFQKAYYTASSSLHEISNVARFNLYKGKNTSVSIGLDPFAFGISITASYKNNNFTSSFSIGMSAISGFYVGGGITYSFGDWTFGVGGAATNVSEGAGVFVTYKQIGLGYNYAYYWENSINDNIVGAQNSAALSVIWPSGSLYLENDFLTFQHQDRWRTGGFELNFGNLSIGSYIYTNDPRGEGQERPKLPGKWENGEVYFSPIWIGYNVNNTTNRIGYSHKQIQHITQNLMVHKYGFLGLGFGKAPYFANYDYFLSGFYGYSGYLNPYAFYTK